MDSGWWIGLVGIIPAMIAGYRYRWGCRLGMHRYREAFPAVYQHLECQQCGHRVIRDPGLTHRKAPIDTGWLKTGEKTRLKMPGKTGGAAIWRPDGHPGKRQ